MGPSLFSGSTLKQAFISLSVVVTISMCLMAVRQSDPWSLRNVKSKEQAQIDGDIPQDHARTSTENLSMNITEEMVPITKETSSTPTTTQESTTTLMQTSSTTTTNSTTTTTTTKATTTKATTTTQKRVMVAKVPPHQAKAGGDLPKCPPTPPLLLGDKVAHQAVLPQELASFATISKLNPNLLPGGHFAPWWCKARYKVAIIIPMRGREQHLPGLLAHMHPIWQRQEIDYTVYVITQAGTELFNKGKLMNAGFMEARRERLYDCYVFHDADLLLEDDRCLYWCPQHHSAARNEVVHLAYLVNKFEYKPLRYLPPCMPQTFRPGKLDYFGGITMFTSDQFLNINGFSNIYWGWGAEDNDASIRVEHLGYQIRRSPECRYRMYKHDGVGKNGTNPIVRQMMRDSLVRMRGDGLNSLKYKLVSRITGRLFTNITIDVGKPSPLLLKLMAGLQESQSCGGAIFTDHDEWEIW